MNSYIDITEIVSAVIALIVAVITYFVIPLLRQKVEAGKLERIEKWVKTAVEAAEMIYKGSGLGDQKKAYVLKFLAEKGYTMDIDSIDSMIEAAVHELNQGK